MSNPTNPESNGVGVPERVATPLSQWTNALRAHSKNFWSALPCIVVSFNAATQTIVAQPAIKEQVLISGVPTTRLLPQLTDVPVLLSGGGGFTLTFPIAPGDECLVVFADMCTGAWFQSGGVQSEFEHHRHALSDGFAIFQPRSQPRVLSGYSTTAVQLRNDAGTVHVDVTGATVSVTAPTVNVTASTSASVTAPTVNVAGSTAVNITGGHCSVDGKNFLAHTHSGVSSGASSSGPVV